MVLNAMKIKSMVSKFIFLAIVFAGLSVTDCSGSEPDYVLNNNPKNIVFALGFGYGIANNPCTDCNTSLSSNGLLVAASLGYKVNSRFKLDFGPAVWIEGKDIPGGSNAKNEAPANKRLVISFNGYYSPFHKIPLSLKLGAGIGSIVYTNENRRVSIDNQSTENTEFMSGFAGTAALIYSLQLSPSLKIHPSLNISYTDITAPDSTFHGYLDSSKPSIITDLRINLFFNF